jgi:hypothetical protein
MKRSEMIQIIVEELEQIEFADSNLGDWASLEAIHAMASKSLETVEKSGMLPPERNISYSDIEYLRGVKRNPCIIYQEVHQWESEEEE